MKTTDKKNIEIEMQDEYLFDYSKAKPNRFANKLNNDHILVSIDNDLSLIFNDENKVNKALRDYLTLIESKQVSTQL